MEKFKHDELMKTLKKALKKKKITYSDLAKKLKMSTSGVQKIFIGKDTSICRVAEICSILDISLGQLINESQKMNVKRLKFTKKQEDFFVKNPSHFYFYWELLVSEFKPENVQKEFNLTKKSINKFLLDLDKIDVIELHPGDKAKSKIKGKYFSVRNNPTIGNLLSKYEVNLIRHIKENRPKHSSSSFSSKIRIRKELLDEMVAELEKVSFKYIHRAVNEEPFYKDSELLEVAHLTAITPIKRKELISL